MRSLVLAEWARLGLYLETDPLTAERTLVMAFISPHDATLQHYLLTLPKDWDPEKSYPLFFELHGAGDANPLAGPAILAGASRRDPPGSRLAENAAHLPVWIWCGEEDRLFPDMQRMIREFEAAGIKPVTSSTPGLGHHYTMAKQEEAVNWLQQFTRRRPDHFTYRADTDSQTGAWGIRMERNPAMSGTPVFKCSIDGQIVTLESESDQ